MLISRAFINKTEKNCKVYGVLGVFAQSDDQAKKS